MNEKIFSFTPRNVIINNFYSASFMCFIDPPLAACHHWTDYFPMFISFVELFISRTARVVGHYIDNKKRHNMELLKLSMKL